MSKADYAQGYRDGYAAAVNQQIDAEKEHQASTSEGKRAFAELALHGALDRHFAAKQLAQDYTRAKGADAGRIGKLVSHTKQFLKEQPVYQGVNDLCAHCGQPSGDSGMWTLDGQGREYMFCSDACRKAHL